ncbi:GDCCVxC domain-containing (seleno)protein [Zobellella maritima]|uniref:GDCCVxC domain-containing (seleno)protein n=1 Tax=Zobellella maritima TaxID=2059725 RepID=UPI000E307295|nr:GDCCVxC domain-containing (seleno)protein [Zobellella maritima]
MKPKLTSEITCPKCGHREVEIMLEDSCQYFYECKKCNVVLKPRHGDCCVFCSYGDTPCPPVQLDQSCC